MGVGARAAAQSKVDLLGNMEAVYIDRAVTRRRIIYPGRHDVGVREMKYVKQ